MFNAQLSIFKYGNEVLKKFRNYKDQMLKRVMPDSISE